MDLFNKIDFLWLKSIARNETTKNYLIYIEKITQDAAKDIYSYDRTLICLYLGSYKIWMTICDSPQTLAIYTEIFTNNPHNHVYYPGFLADNSSTIIDLGANIGLYALRIKQTNPQCKIICLEPNPFTFEILQRNVKENKLHNITLINRAVNVANDNMQLKLIHHATALSGKYLDIIKKEKRSWITQSMIEIINVKCTTLKNILSKYNLSAVDILKMDIEGMELEILESSIPILNKINKIIIEWHSVEIRKGLIHLLEKNNFKLVFEEKRDYGDLYFIKKV